MVTAPKKSELAANPHSTQTNVDCVLRFSADVCPHSWHLRLVFCGGTATSKPPCHCVLYSNWRRNSNGLASKSERFSPDFCATFFVARLLMLPTCRSSTPTPTRFFLISSHPFVPNLFFFFPLFVSPLL